MTDHKNEGLRRMQAVARIRRTTAGSEMMRHRSTLSMKQVEHLKKMHAGYWHDSMSRVPSGWYPLLLDFIEELDGLGDLADSVSIRIETETGCKAFVFPEMTSWHPHQVADLRAAQRSLYGLSQQTCERCGQTGSPREFGSSTLFLCEEHTAKAEQDIEPILARRRCSCDLYNEMDILWPSTSGLIDLDLPEYLEAVLYDGLRKIKALVIDAEFEGHVFIALIQQDRGSLYVAVRYHEMPWSNIALMLEIEEEIKAIHIYSDLASEKHSEADHDDE